MKKHCPNSFHWSLAGDRRWEMYYRPVLRQPAPGEPDVPDLVHLGDWLISHDPIRGYRYGEGLVVGITKHVGLPGLECVHYSIAYILDYKLRSPRRPPGEAPFGGANDVAAQGGRLVGLFEADTSEYIVTRPPADLKIPAWAYRILDAKRQLRLF